MRSAWIMLSYICWILMYLTPAVITCCNDLDTLSMVHNTCTHLDTDTLLATDHHTPPPQQSRRWLPANASLTFSSSQIQSLDPCMWSITKISKCVWKKKDVSHNSFIRSYNLVCCLAFSLPTLSDVTIACAGSLNEQSAES